MELITVEMHRGDFKLCQKTSQSTYFSWCTLGISCIDFLYWRTKRPKPTRNTVTTWKGGFGGHTENNPAHVHLTLSYARLNTWCLLCTQPVWKRAARTPHTPSRSVRSGGRILILVRQPDPRFTPRVWLVPIVHCQGLLMERQHEWILSPHKWLSDRAPSSITSYNVGVQKMRPSGGLIWCFICSFEKLVSFPLPLQIHSGTSVFTHVHM